MHLILDSVKSQIKETTRAMTDISEESLGSF